MWVRIKETGQELFMNDEETRFGPGALKLVAQGDAVEIAQPTMAAPVPLKFQPVADGISPEARRIVHDIAIANVPQSYTFIKRFLDLEALVAELDDRVSRLAARIGEVHVRVEELEARAKGKHKHA